MNSQPKKRIPPFQLCSRIFNESTDIDDSARKIRNRGRIDVNRINQKHNYRKRYFRKCGKCIVYKLNYDGRKWTVLSQIVLNICEKKNVGLIMRLSDRVGESEGQTSQTPQFGSPCVLYHRDKITVAFRCRDKVNFFQHMKELNLKLQGNDIFAHEMFSTVRAIKLKNKLFYRQVSHNIITRFLKLENVALKII
ncbi:hypothetical protein RF11_01565 [Thelohanellus kitauei]|uniref:Uncharacterized protein n=1 Tax=Thelohanellus kitauei TaxID=669202 RepID=A0A0C2JF61_THEKT|nr:hypothetical protein RF11_01565 [Thelohanellus kitauei]